MKALLFGMKYIGQTINLKMKVDEGLGALLFGTDVPLAKPEIFTPSLDPYVSEADRRTVARLPEEGKRQFRENVHQYIGQLGKDYQVGEERKE